MKPRPHPKHRASGAVRPAAGDAPGHPDFRFNRREFLQLCAAGAAGAVFFSCGDDGLMPDPDAGADSGSDPATDLVLINGLVYLDGSFQRRDIGYRQGVITEIAETIAVDPSQTSTAVIDCQGMYITPGWADLHVHIGQIGVEVAKLGAPMGVTALVDAGSWGPATFGRFYNEYITGTTTPIFTLLNLIKDGLTLETLQDPVVAEMLDIEGAKALIQTHPDLIRGLKVRSDVTNISEEDPLLLATTTAALGRELDLPVMYHLGDPSPSVQEFLALAKPGDIVTHALRKNTNCVLDVQGNLLSEVVAAQQNGVVFDVGHGATSFSFETVDRALAQGFNGFTISSDLHGFSQISGALTFANVLSKFLALGLSLEAITAAAGVRPRTYLGLPSQIAVNSAVDLTVFSVPSGTFEYMDTEGASRTHTQRIIPEYAILSGQAIRAGDEDRAQFMG